jgi:hypothetical protein
MAPASRDLNADIDAAAATLEGAIPPSGAPPHDLRSPPANPLSWYASFTMLTQDGFLIHRRGYISADLDRILLKSSLGETVRSWNLDLIDQIKFGASFRFEDLKIWIGPQQGLIRGRDLQPAPPSVRACSVVCVGSQANSVSSLRSVVVLGNGPQPSTVHRPRDLSGCRGKIPQFDPSLIRLNPRSADRARVVFVPNPNPQIDNRRSPPPNPPTV